MIGLPGWFVLSLLPFLAPRSSEPPPEQAATEAVAWHEQIVVTATRLEQPAEEVAGHVTVLERRDLEQSAAQTVDDALRRVPGFSLFRRSGSLVSHPTAQGVSLRGIGPSGVSRSLVLVDGVPLNDPFGGWVYWSMVPLASLERVEVVRGGASHLWGNYALGGVIHLLTAAPTAKTWRLLGETGGRGEVNLDLAASNVVGPLGMGLEASYFETAGYPVVRRDQRGAIDEPADSRHGTLNGQLRLAVSPNVRMTLRGRGFSEERGNGTPLTHNATDAGSLTVSTSVHTAQRGDWELLVSGSRQSFASTFSSPAADRSSEVPALDQFDVGARALQADLQWSKQLRPAHLLTAGTDLRLVDGSTHEDFLFLEGRFTRRRRAGGEQLLWGGYLQEIFTPAARWELVAGGRFDRWESSAGSRVERSLEGGGEILRDLAFADRVRTTFSSQVALLWHATERLALRGSYYRSFRAPTLNELFRPFRVRGDVTEANAELTMERLVGAEVGLAYRTPAATAQLTGFLNEIEDPIANVTIAPGPGTVPPCGFVPAGGLCQQRQNLGRLRVRGIEAELRLRPALSWELAASYLFDDTEILKAPNQPALEGKRSAQVPAHQLVLQLSYSHPARFTISLQGRYVGAQFEDDLNARLLADFVTVDLKLSRQLKPGWEIFLAVENLFDATYEVGKTADGLVTVGAPALMHGGFRLRLQPVAHQPI